MTSDSSSCSGGGTGRSEAVITTPCHSSRSLPGTREHADSQPLRTLLELADRTIWPRIAGGCHPTRDTEAAIEAAGFHIEHCDRFSFSPSLVSPKIPHRLGTARRT